jgi:hypothetical protein
MREALEQTIKALSDTDAGWVARRDAAELLGHTAADAISALKTYQEDSDHDVRRAVGHALQSATDALRGAAPSADSEHPALERMVRALESEGKREVTATKTGFDVKVFLPNDRHQTVKVEPGESQSGNETVHVWTSCADSTASAFEWALKNNNYFALCAVAIKEVDGQERLCMLGSFLSEGLTPGTLKAAVKEVAFYGDWLENKLTRGGDIF